jgi:ketosteroid isomerase-like protein
MSVKKLLEALDTQIVSGDILGAFDQFFAEDCVTMSNENDKTSSKAQKHQGLQWFFDGMVRTNRIERLKARVDGDVSLSEFVFDFTDRAGKNHLWHEVIRRVWRDGKVVEEKYYLDLHNENPLSETAKSEAPAKAPRTAAKAEPAKTETPAKATRSAAQAKPVKTEAPAKAPRSAAQAKPVKTEAPVKAPRSAAKAKPAAEASSDQKPASTTSKKATARK